MWALHIFHDMDNGCILQKISMKSYGGQQDIYFFLTGENI